MKTYTSHGYRAVNAENMSEAAEIFAGREARKQFGRGGYCRTCRLNSWSADGTLGEYEAFIGYSTRRGETTGRNVRFSVYIQQ